MDLSWLYFARFFHLSLVRFYGLVTVGILFIAIVVLEFFHLERYFAFAFVLASLGFAISLTLFNVDAAIVKRNISRVSLGKNLNVGHLTSLSTDAIPALVEAYQSQNIPETTREGIGAILACYLSENESTEKSDDWRSFNYSYWKASQLLAEMKPFLKTYRVSGNGSSLRVRTPSNVLYECREY